MSSPILVTGLGTVGSFGFGADALRKALAAGEAATTEIDRKAGYHLEAGARLACLVPPGLVPAWIAPGEARRMSPPSRLAVAAARMALSCAGLGRSEDFSDAAVVVATVYGPSSYTEGLLRQILFESPEAASPTLFTESVANAPAAQIAISLKARGPSHTVCQREAGPLLAVARAAAELASGRRRRAFAGTVEEMTPLLHAILDRFGALAHGEPEQARPFDRERNGFLAGEGAAMLVLEDEGLAQSRGARPLARVLGWGSAFDASAPPSGWGEGAEVLGRALRRTLERAGVAPGAVDLVVSGASGAVAGDRLEARTLQAAWEGAPLPPVVAPKAVTGEYGGGHLAAAVLAASGARLGPAPGFSARDPELGIVPHDGSPLSPPKTVLVTSLASGGAAAWLVLGGP